MEFGKHLGKGLWGLGDKALPVAYGLGFVLLVIRVLPERDFGYFVLVQEVFLVVSTLTAAFALQPMTKYLAEEGSDTREVVGAGLLFSLSITAVASAVILLIAEPFSDILNAEGLAPLMRTVPIMLVASFPRNFAIAILQARFCTNRLFWVDVAHFLGAPILVWVLSRLHRFHTAEDLIAITIASLSFSSILGIILTRAHFAVSFRPGPRHLLRMWNYSSYSLGSNVSTLLYSKADTFILSAFTGPVDVAVYSSAKIFTRLFEMVTQIVQMFVLPAASRLGSQGDRDAVRVIVEKVLLFLTVVMLPVLVLLALLPELLLHIVYGGRYPEAVTILRIFAFVALPIPLLAVGSSVLLGLGEAKASFILGVQTLIVSVTLYLLLIASYGATGAALASAAGAYIMAWITLRTIRRHVSFTIPGALSRHRDITAFLRRQVSLLRGRGRARE